MSNSNNLFNDFDFDFDLNDVKKSNSKDQPNSSSSESSSKVNLTKETTKETNTSENANSSASDSSSSLGSDSLGSAFNSSSSTKFSGFSDINLDSSTNPFSSGEDFNFDDSSNFNQNKTGTPASSSSTTTTAPINQDLDRTFNTQLWKDIAPEEQQKLIDDFNKENKDQVFNIFVGIPGSGKTVLISSILKVLNSYFEGTVMLDEQATFADRRYYNKLIDLGSSNEGVFGSTSNSSYYKCPLVMTPADDPKISYKVTLVDIAGENLATEKTYSQGFSVDIAKMLRSEAKVNLIYLLDPDSPSTDRDQAAYIRFFQDEVLKIQHNTNKLFNKLVVVTKADKFEGRTKWIDRLVNVEEEDVLDLLHDVARTNGALKILLNSLDNDPADVEGTYYSAGIFKGEMSGKDIFIEHNDLTSIYATFQEFLMNWICDTSTVVKNKKPPKTKEDSNIFGFIKNIFS